MNKMNKQFKNTNKQNGMALIVVMVVLTALTLMGLAASDSSNLQSIMARNNQFRLEAFNTSNAEIGAQIDYYDEVAVGDNPIYVAIDGAARIDSLGTDLDLKTTNTHFTKEVGLENTGECAIEGNSLGKYKCNLMLIDSDARYLASNINSLQMQTFSYITLE